MVNAASEMFSSPVVPDLDYWLAHVSKACPVLQQHPVQRPSESADVSTPIFARWIGHGTYALPLHSKFQSQKQESAGAHLHLQKPHRIF